MLVIGGLTAVGVVVTQRHLSRIAARELQVFIDQQISAADNTRQVRHGVLSEISDNFARKSRIRAALEDDALDLLYPSAHEELRQLMRGPDNPEAPTDLLRARFYRFLDVRGAIIPPVDSISSGLLDEVDAARLVLPEAPTQEEVGYIRLPDDETADAVVEVFAVPIIASERLQVIAALVVGFPFAASRDIPANETLRAGLWIDEQLIVPGMSAETTAKLTQTIHEHFADPAGSTLLDTLVLDNAPCRVDLQPLNPGSAYPLAYEVFIASLAELDVQQARMQVQILVAAGVLFLLGLGLSHLMARRLARPVEALAEASAEEHVQRVRAEEALDLTNRELERAARFSADASHQLKTPVAVMRAGLEELLATADLSPNSQREVSGLIDQTGRLSTVIEDLLLLSRLDAGRLHLDLKPENLRLLIDGLLDDFSILPDADQITLEVTVDPAINIEGDRRYTALILQNLLDNARKYNRPGGRIRISAAVNEERVHCRIGNTGRSITARAQTQIFERFHRGESGENVPGYGLGLNLAQELARLHSGKLRLLESGDDWTEFELVLRIATNTPGAEPKA